MSAHLQEGIYYASGTRPGRFFGLLFLRAVSGVSAGEVGECLLALWQMYQGLKLGQIRDLPGHLVPAGDLSALVGYGLNAFSLSGARRTLPTDLRKFGRFRSALPTGGGPVLIGSGLKYADDIQLNPATEDIVVQLIADTQLAVNRGIVETWKLISDVIDPQTEVAPLALTSFFTGFQRDDARSWIDFHDGISNMASGERLGAIAIKGTNLPEEQWTQEGTYLAFLRVAVDLPGWRKLTRKQQEIFVGRDKLSGCPLHTIDAQGNPVVMQGCPVSGTSEISEPGNANFRDAPNVGPLELKHSHVQRANHHVGPITDPSSLRIFRQGYEFLEPTNSAPGFRAGLNFVSFQDTPQRLLRMLTQNTWLGRTNFAGDPDASEQGIHSLLTVRAGGIYLVPPVTDGEVFPGSSIFQ